MQSGVYLFLLVAAFIAANIPWLGESFLGFVRMRKNAWWRWLEWLILYGLVGLFAIFLEYNQTGVIHRQDWEFYATTLSLFVVFALPGFIYHYDLKRILSGKKEM